MWNKKPIGFDLLPNNPGVYLYFDTNQKVIYIGKAKNLKKRVSSYFNKPSNSVRFTNFLSQIYKVDFIVVDSEAEALLLENTYIKKYQPKYNIQLKDDKTYPSICIKKEPYSRVFLTRRIYRDGSEFFGPYASVRTAKMFLDFIKILYPIRICSLNLSDNTKTYKPCLQYQIKRCAAPCINKQTLEEYNNNLESIKKILKGSFLEIKTIFQKEMNYYSELLSFEKAKEFKDKLELVNRFQEKSLVISQTNRSFDVFFLLKETNLSFCGFLRVKGGILLYSHTFQISTPLDNSPSELIAYAILQIKSLIGDLQSEIIVPFLPNIEIEDVYFTIPLRGVKKNILGLAEKNCKTHILQRMKLLDIHSPEMALKNRLYELKNTLGLTQEPTHIECFDNSNLQGTNPVASCVVFKNTRPSKKDYRHFFIKTVDSPNDFASMEEIVFRRYKRVLEDGENLPQLIVVDGGRGQLNAAVQSLDKLGVLEKVNIIGLAKRLEEVILPNDTVSLFLNKSSFTLKLLMQIRDEAHRFAITFHKKKRTQRMLNHPLTHIAGLGKISIEKLLSAYKTIVNIKSAGYQDVKLHIGKRTADALQQAGFFENM
ncbi:MAG: excinuclease ABC subunit UvrC [Bacteroidales bacterium]